MRMHLPNLVLAVLGLASCSTTSTVEKGESCFELCIGAATEAEVSLELETTAQVTAALEAERSTFALYLDGAATLDGLVDNLLKGSLSLPKGFRYLGAGVYAVDAPNGATARVEFFLPANTSYGNVGDKITWNLFEPSNYFTGLKGTSSVEVSLSGVSTKFEYAFSNTGPGTELLGLGASPKSPIDFDQSKMSAALTKTASAASVTLSPGKNDVVDRLEITSEKVASSAVDHAAVALSVDAFGGTNGALKQQLTLGGERLVLVNRGAGYTGNFDFSAISPKFSFDARLRFDARAVADIAFGCPGTTISFPDDPGQ